MPQTKEQLASNAINKSRECLKIAVRAMTEMTQHKGGYTTSYKSTLDADYTSNLKLGQQLLHYAIENITGLSNVASNPTTKKLTELGVIIVDEPAPEPEPAPVV